MTVELDLLAFPDDVIIAFVAYLDVLTILALKETCWRLYNVSKVHAVWCNALSVFREAYPEVPCELEGPVAFYSSQELEARVVRFDRLQRNWTDSDAPRNAYRLKMLDYSEEADETLKILIPGGRWLLNFTSGRSGEGKILAFDLEGPCQETGIPCELLMTVDRVRRFTAVTYCVREDEPSLTFDLAIVYEVQNPPPAIKADSRLSVWRQVTSRMVIYRVALVGPSHTNSKLLATCLQTMDLSPEHRKATSLYGNIMAIDRRVETDPNVMVSSKVGFDVLDWTRSSDAVSVGATFRCSFLSKRRGVLPFCLQLASSQRLLVVAGQAIMVYRIPALQLIDCKVAFLPDVTQSVILTPILVLSPSSDRCIGLSPPISFTIKLKDQEIITAHRSKLSRIRIPSDDFSDASFESWAYPSGKADFCVVGRTRVAWTLDMISSLTKTWIVASVENLCGKFSVTVTTRRMMDPPGPEAFNQSVLFDEVSGHMVFGQRKGRSMQTMVIEFA